LVEFAVLPAKQKATDGGDFSKKGFKTVTIKSPRASAIVKNGPVREAKRKIIENISCHSAKISNT